MKRALVLPCLLLLLFLAVTYRGGGENAPYTAAADALAALSAEGGTLTVYGTAAQCSATENGLRVTVDHLTVRQDDTFQTSNSHQRNRSKAEHALQQGGTFKADDVLHQITYPEPDNRRSVTLRADFGLMASVAWTDVVPGDRIVLRGTFLPFERATNPGQFDAQAYYRVQGILGTLQRPRLTAVKRGGFSAAGAAYRLRSLLRASFLRILPEREARTAAAITLGERSWLLREWKQVYQEGGISHILAVSGLHISLLGMGLYRLLRRFRLRFIPSAAVSAALLLFYVLLCGAGLSARRAWLMFLIWLGAQVCGRKYDMVTAIFVSAALLAGENGAYLFQASCQLSFLAVLSLAVLAPALMQLFRLKGAAAGAAAASVSVWLGTLPCTLFFFFQTSPWSLLVNLAVVPLMGAVMASGLAAAAAGLLFVPAGVFLAAPLRYLLGCFDVLCRAQQQLPAPVWVTGRPQTGCILLYYAVLALTVWASHRIAKGGAAGQRRRCSRADRKKSSRFGSGRKERRRLRADRKKSSRFGSGRQERKRPRADWQRRLAAAGLWGGCIALCMFLVWFQPRAGKLRITCLDVGQGDGTLLRLPGGENVLIDGGSSSRSEVWEFVIEPALKRYGVDTLDYIFLSHADQDHINGIRQYLEAYACGFGAQNVHGISVKRLVLPPSAAQEDFAELLQLADAKGIEVCRMEAGGAVRAGGCSLNCLAPQKERLRGERNQDSMVLRLSYGRFRMLFTGDLEGEAEQALARTDAALRADVLKAGHHGSDNACSELFLAQMQPEAAVISCGKNNRYGHPGEETLERLEASGSSVYVTSQCGAVEITTDGRTFAVKSG